MEKINDNILNLFDLNVQTLEKIKELYNGELEKENNEKSDSFKKKVHYY